MEVKMNTLTKKIRTMKTKTIMAFLSALFITATLEAQNNEPRPEKPAGMAPAFFKSPTFEIDFPGGTPEALVQELAKHSGTRPNVIIPSHLEKVALPKFRFQN